MAYFIPSPTSFPTIPDFSSAPGVSGFHLDFLSTTEMFLTPGYARAFGTDYQISYPANQPDLPASIGLDITLAGPGGCWPFAISDMTLTDDTVFGIYVIAKSSGTTGSSLNPAVNVSAVIATGNNFLPPGYDQFRRVGLCYIDSGTNLLIKWIQAGLSNDRQYLLQDPVYAIQDGNSLTYVNLDLTEGTNGDGVIPPGHANYAQLTISFIADAPGDYASISPTVLNATVLPPVTIANPGTGLMSITTEMVCGILGDVTGNGNAAIKYLVSSAASPVTIAVAGFTDSLGNNLF